MKKNLELFIKALRERANIYCLIGKYDKGIDDFDSALTHSRIEYEQNKKLIGEILIEKAYIFVTGISNYDEAKELTTTGLRLLSTDTLTPSYARGFNILGIIGLRTGDYKNAIKEYKNALKIHKKLNNIKGICATYINIGTVYKNLGNRRLALKYLNDALTISEEIKDMRFTTVAYNNIGNIYYYNKEFDKALEYYSRHLKISKRIGYKFGIGTASNNLGLIYWEKKDFNKALRYQRIKYNISKELGHQRGIGMAASNIGSIYMDKGQSKKSSKYFDTHLRISKKIGYKRGIGVASINLGTVSFVMKDYKKAEMYFENSLAIFKEINEETSIMENYMVFIQLYKETNDDIKTLKYCVELYLLSNNNEVKRFKILALKELSVLANKISIKDLPGEIKKILLKEKVIHWKVTMEKILQDLVTHSKKKGLQKKPLK
ncbi:tetratricopeptide repeat protein [bacterium]|nr:tetratricopeptide repeat protein [bacterium]